MNYEEKYKQALERARYYHSKNYMLINNAIENIFPELKEDEDERIRKKLICFVENWKKFNPNSPFDDYAVYTSDSGECDKILAWLEKQGEQPTDKVEQKFKVGDWVIFNGTVAQILDKQKYGFVGLDIDGKDFFCNYGHTDSMRLWSINDAKDGDVLSYVIDEENLWIMIYRSLYEPYEGHVHYHALLVNDNFSDKGTCCICIDKLKPATKEQRDLLFSKIKQAGYEWVADKKELKKIEGKKLDADKVIEWLNHHELSRDDVVTSVIPDDSPTSVPHRVKWLSDEFIKQFKKYFEI